MARMRQQERLQPSLLDRLTDDDPSAREEGLQQRLISLAKLRKCVLRDLVWLLNTANFAQTEDLDGFPFVERSVVNYGWIDLAGRTVSGIDLYSLERRIERSIELFEPRILSDTLRVKCKVDLNHIVNPLVFQIEGQLWSEPVPYHLVIRTELDLETGKVDLAEARD